MFSLRNLRGKLNTLRSLPKRMAELEAAFAELKQREIQWKKERPTYPYFKPNIKDKNNIGLKILYDEIDRPGYALGLWLATIQAAKMGIKKLSVIEFGVAFGHDLLNLCNICSLITDSTDVEFEIYGFDSDVGMPEILDYKDHPEIWHTGQFKSDHDAIRRNLTPNAQLISGNIKNTLDDFVKTKLREDCPLGLVSVDVDLYSSAKQCLELFKAGTPKCYLPTTIVWMDDINDLLTCNNWAGEALAIQEFNAESEFRKLQELRVRQNHPPAGWHDHLYGLHVLNHPARTGEMPEGLLHNINITAL